MLHLDVGRQILHVLGKGDIEWDRRRHDRRRLPPHASCTVSQGWTDTALLEQVVLHVLVRLDLLLLQPELLLLPFQFLVLELLLQLDELLALLAFSLFLEFEQLSLLLLLLELEEMDLVLLLLLMEARRL